MVCLNVFFLNVRGMRDFVKRRVIFDFVDFLYVFICFL